MTPDRPPPDSDPLRDPRLDAAWSALSREEPPAALDARILAAAHRAVGARPERTELREATRPKRWWWPLAAAASIGAVAFGILQVIGPQPPDVPQAERAVSDAPALAKDAAEPREAAGKSAVGGVAPAPAPAPAAAFRAEAQRKTTAPLPVDEWLARIRKLRTEGRAEDLALEIAAFRAAYPGEEKRLQEELARPLPPRE